MKILGIDTTTKFLCLAIYDNGRVYGYNLEVATKLSSLLAVTIERVLDSFGWRAQDIDYFACGIGPGSFTGIRVGIAAIKGLSWAANKPVIEIPSLDLLAMNAKDTDKPVIPVIDAKRNLIYCSVYKKKNGMIRKIKPYMLLSEKELFKIIKSGAIILGDAIGLYKERIQLNSKGAIFLDKDYWYPKARNIAALALGKIKDKKLSDAFSVKPIYLYPKDCQIRK